MPANDIVIYGNVDGNLTLGIGQDVAIGVAIEFTDLVPSGVELFAASGTLEEGAQNLNEFFDNVDKQRTIDKLPDILVGLHASIGANGGLVVGSLDDFHGETISVQGDLSLMGGALFTPRTEDGSWKLRGTGVEVGVGPGWGVSIGTIQTAPLLTIRGENSPGFNRDGIVFWGFE